MDEYNLANVFLNHDEIQNRVVSMDTFQKIPFAELSGLGGAIAELIPQFRTISEMKTIPMDGCFRQLILKQGKLCPILCTVPSRLRMPILEA